MEAKSGYYGDRPWPQRDPIELQDSVKAAAGIPRRFFSTYIDTMVPKNREQADIKNDMLNLMMTSLDDRFQSLVISGGCGTGKTHLGAGYINTLQSFGGSRRIRDFNALYVNEADLLMRTTSFRSTRDWFSIYTDESVFLVIDEFGMSEWSPTENRRVEQLMNKRFSNGYKTVILTNLSSEELFNKISSQLKSRLFTGRFRALTGEDLRLKKDSDSEWEDF